ncbi:uncharacterized protein LOC126910411 [Daktulosphaira vitifoliae]|uniref:uncharacterized protein LOC126910411 n=1 Tax=Daktulosphaira vitifoliae TaxID=58002 RepID=UPI0021AAA9D1|nr:uncharacterized protein LOC126910411 [Daktulosphaira vitifoliae]
MSINKSMIPIKLSFFFFYGCIGPIYIFLPTITKQLGYTMSTYGTIMTCATLLGMIASPIFGQIVDKYPVRKKIFFTAMIIGGACCLSIMFIPGFPLDTNSELVCGNETYLNVISQTYQQSVCDDKKLFNPMNSGIINCELRCQRIPFTIEPLKKEAECENCFNNLMMNESSSHLIKSIQDNYPFKISINVNFTEHIQYIYVFRVLSAQLNDTQILKLNCVNYVKSSCHLNCSNDLLMDLASTPAITGSVTQYNQFWIFFIVLVMMSISFNITDNLQTSLCLDLLGQNHHYFGKNKCWTSIGWGVFSIIGGWLVDNFSPNPRHKNYSPIFLSSIMLTIFYLIVALKIKIVETTGKKNNVDGQFVSVRLFRKCYVLIFFTWIFVMQFFHSIIAHFLFWYLDDLADNYECSKREWMKTVQGLAQGIQCFGGELPFYFWSGWIIQKLGYLNCMALSLGVLSIRMFLYSTLTNPTWVILIEITNGISYALAVAAKMSYAKLICSPDQLNSTIGFVGFFIIGADSLGSFVGGHFYEAYGGVKMFKYCSYLVGILCILQILCNYFGLSKEFKEKNVSTSIQENKLDSKL